MNPLYGKPIPAAHWLLEAMLRTEFINRLRASHLHSGLMALDLRQLSDVLTTQLWLEAEEGLWKC